MVNIPELPNIDGGAGAPSNDQAGPQEGDNINCDSTGTCYDGERARTPEGAPEPDKGPWKLIRHGLKIIIFTK